jgi:putative oxidoreductase
MGSVAEEEMNSFWQIFWPVLAAILASVAVVVLTVTKGFTVKFLWRIVSLIVAAVFIYAGVLKVVDPVQFAHDIDNYRVLPWTISVGLAFYLPWLEIFCGFALAVGLLYRGALSILTVLIVVFTLATIAAKARGLDITCGCFGHASQHWSFPAHLATNVGILAALLVLFFLGTARAKAVL